MKKDITICFRTSKDIREFLDKLAKEEHKTLSSAIEDIICHLIKREEHFQGTKKGSNEHSPARRFLCQPSLKKTA